MPSHCEQIRIEYESLKALKGEFDAAYKTGNLDEAKRLRAELEQGIDVLRQKLWPFDREIYSKEKFMEHYNQAVACYRERKLLITLSSGKEGIRDEWGGEHVMLTPQEIIARLRKNKEFYQEKFETLENPRILPSLFALDHEVLAQAYSEQIEEYFVEDTSQADPAKRIPDKAKTKLFGVDGEPLELRKDKENVYISDGLKPMKYFPKWKEVGGKVEAEGGLAKQEAIAEFGGVQIFIVEDIPLAPGKGQGKETRARNGKTRKQVEGGQNVAQQYGHLALLKEEGLTLEDHLCWAMIFLKRNIVLDDDRGSSYYCRILGATAAGRVPSFFWYRGRRQALLGGNFPEHSDDDFHGARGVVSVP